jgi:hypothetical protein
MIDDDDDYDDSMYDFALSDVQIPDQPSSLPMVGQRSVLERLLGDDYDMFYHIIRQLPVITIRNVSKSCKTFNSIIVNPASWHNSAIYNTFHGNDDRLRLINVIQKRIYIRNWRRDYKSILPAWRSAFYRQYVRRTEVSDCVLSTILKTPNPQNIVLNLYTDQCSFMINILGLVESGRKMFGYHRFKQYPYVIKNNTIC